ncbi:TonB family protein [Larkinella bovis]|uniref:TonB family protein n=1 Tax=Larkinella bovis TaxID=683041 RepID=A0ABW0IA52_9BACT
MSDTHRHTAPLTADDLQQYRAGTLSAAERHRVERLLLENPFYAEALDGLEAIENQNIALNRISDELRGRLQNRVQNSNRRRLPFWIPAAVASVVLVLGMGLYVWLPKSLETPETSSAARVTTSPKTALPIDDPPTRQPEPLAKKVVEQNRPPSTRKTAEPHNNRAVSPNELVATSTHPAEVEERRFSATPAPAGARTQAFRIAESAPRPGFTGRVIDENNLPLAGVSVLIKNSPRRTITDTTGRFRLTQLQKTDTLQFIHLGYLKQEVRATDLPVTSLQLHPDTQTLAEVVIMGDKVQQRVALTGRMAQKPSQLINPQAPPNFQTYLDKNRRMPPEAKEKGISGTVRLRFTVTENGIVSRIMVVKSLGYGCDEEAIRLIQEGPRWQPALRKGKPHARVVEQEIVF